MFVPRAALSSASSQRNPRRRQRTGSDDSVNPPKAKRQRSALGQKTIDPSSETRVEHSGNDHSEIRVPNITNGANISTENSVTQSYLPMRPHQKSERREEENGGTVLLSETEFYTVAQLPALPDQIRSLQSKDIACSFESTQGYALALTHTHAITWPYSDTASSPSPADVVALPIPESWVEPSQAPPLGVLLSTALTGTPGLMVVMRQTGTIMYWETVSSAASLGLPRQKQGGLQGCVPGLLSGETVSGIMNAEPSGVIVTLSSGRVAHIAVRDPQGKAKITVNFLATPFGKGKLGIFSGIKNVLGAGFGRKDLVSVRAGNSHQRGHREIIIANSTGLFEIWDTYWNHGSVLKKQIDIKSDLGNLLDSRYVNSAGNYDIKVLDFTPTPSDNLSHDSQDERSPWLFSIIVAPPSTVLTDMCLVQIAVSDQIHIQAINNIELRTIPVGIHDPKPRLLLPKPGDTAFVVIGQSIILLSLARVAESPTRQLLADSDRPPQPFHDIINLRSGRSYDVLGSGAEDQNAEHPSPACLLLVRDFGVIRISALSHQAIEADGEDRQMTAKLKIEQAVFYGTLSGNPLNLNGRINLDFPTNEIEQGALEICRELLRSTSRFIPTTAISVQQNLRSRAKVLDDLAALLLQQNKVFDRRTWWELLWGAEKIAAQRAMWTVEEQARKIKGNGATFLSHVVDSMSDKFKTAVDSHNKESDPVRMWFLYDTFRMEHIVPWLFHAVKPHKGYSSRQGRKFPEQILEASELCLAVLETAFRFRDEHAGQYGVGDGYLEDGVLSIGYDDLPEFWTSQSISYVETGHLLDLELESCRAWIQQRTSTTSDMPESQIVKEISKNSSRQLRVLGQMHTERIRWLSAQQDPKLIDESITTDQAYTEQLKWELFKLAGIGQLEDAIRLAEKFRHMDALVELIIELQDQTKTGQVPIGTETPGGSSRHAQELTDRISLYFEKFGEPWAEAFFSRQISMGQSGILFAMRKFQPFITRFLRKHPLYSRLSWINDVLGENDYNTAAQCLRSLALEQEKDIWSHRVELSMAKLAKLATWEATSATADPSISSDIRRLDDLTEIDAVQEVIYGNIYPSLQGAIDCNAEVDLAIDQFAQPIAQDRPSLHELLAEALRKVVLRQVIGAERLIDLLTLIYPSQSTECYPNDLAGKEFYLALRVIRLSPCFQQDSRYQLALQKLVWRRSMIRDDWEQTGKAAEEMAGDSETLFCDTSLFHTLSLVLRDRYDSGGADQPTYIPKSPQDVLMNDSDAETLASRFRVEQRSRMSQDLMKENQILHRYIEHGKLEFWFNDLLAHAEEALSSSFATTAQNSIRFEQPELQSPQPAEVSTERSRLSWL